MRPLSIDLRERIVAAYRNQEGSYRVLAARFSVSRAVVGKLVRQQREQGTLQTQVHRRGRKPAISGQMLARLRHSCEHPDATLAERIEALGLDCSVKTMWKTLRRLGWRFKKSRRGPPSKIVRTSPSNVRLACVSAPVDPERLVFVDETGLKTDITRLRGWAERGARLVERFPAGTGKPPRWCTPWHSMAPALRWSSTGPSTASASPGSVSTSWLRPCGPAIWWCWTTSPATSRPQPLRRSKSRGQVGLPAALLSRPEPDRECVLEN